MQNSTSSKLTSKINCITFFAEIKTLMWSPGKAAPKTKAVSTKPAVYISEVHGRLVPEPKKPVKKAAPAKR